jgi:hypothetical protein
MSENAQPTDIDIAAHAFSEAKRVEAEAREARIAAEEHLIELVGLKEEGTMTVKTHWFKVSTTGKLTRSVDQTSAMPVELWRMISRVKSELDVSALKKLATENPDAYREAVKHITTTPAKPSAKVELIQQSQEAA